MTAAIGVSAYVDVPAFLRAAVNLETASLLGLNTTVGVGGVAAGATSLPVVASTGWAVGPLWLLDGPYAEMAQVTGSVDGTHLTLAAPGTQFAHGAGVSASQAGTGGALAEVLLRASAWIENYCQQGTSAIDRSLYAVSRSERWGMPDMRANLDRDGVLVVRPGHFPVQSVTALAIDLGQGQTLSFDATQVQLASNGRVIELPYLLSTAPNPGQVLGCPGVGLSRVRRQWVTLTYTGGLTPGALPYDVRQACIWVASELLAERRNPTGAAAVRQGKFELQARLRGDASPDSLLLAQAKAALEPYRVGQM
ncbi:MAG: hypothetical protein OJF49_002757 [Ktedonobacterales bacterium]|jgi:hypothetical protein|nr:MAG: hypothetical protein OJF49_002757 [Ktedonobacterales bacterium]